MCLFADVKLKNGPLTGHRLLMGVGLQSLLVSSLSSHMRDSVVTLGFCCTLWNISNVPSGMKISQCNLAIPIF